MNFNNSISLDVYSDNADKQFGVMQSRLIEIENSFQDRMNGKSIRGIIGSLCVTVIWLIVFIGWALFARSLSDSAFLVIAMIAVVGLILSMATDNIMDYVYCKKILSYKKVITQLRNRVEKGKKSIKSNHDVLEASRGRGWDAALNASPSIPLEAESVLSTMMGIESLKKGLIHEIKNILYFATVVAVTVAGGVSFIPTTSRIVVEITGRDFQDQTLMVFNIIAIFAACAGEILLARLVWSKTDCEVTNKTLLIVASTPFASFALLLLVTALIMLVMLLIGVVLAILAVVAIGATVFAATSGG